MPRAIFLAVALLVVLVGCAGLGERAPSPTTTETAPSTTTMSTGSTTTTTPEWSCVGEDPPKGTNMLSISPSSAETAKQINDNQRAKFKNLTVEQRKVFLEALGRDCNLVQSVFQFNNNDRVKYVRYDESWYYLRVSIV